MINYFFQDIQPIEIAPQVSSWLENLMRDEDKKTGDITFIFTDDENVLKINKEYLQHDYYTDIITFDYVKGKTINGDIFISLQRVSENSEIFGRTFDEEFRRVLAHGILHLCGYADKSEQQQIQMRAKEDHYLQKYANLS